jgi:tetratricopeptide (TPR) repeat protein
MPDKDTEKNKSQEKDDKQSENIVPEIELADFQQYVQLDIPYSGLSVCALFLLGIMVLSLSSCMSKEEREFNKLMDAFSLGMDYYDKKEYQKAYDCFNKCIEMDSTYVEFYENRGSMSVYLNDMEGSKRDCEKGLSMDSCSKFSLLGLADYYDRRKDYQKAAYYYEKLIACDSTDFPSYLNYGISSYMDGNYRNALIQFLKYIDYIREDPTPHEYIGRIFQENGDSVTAEISFNRAKEIRKQKDYVGKDGKPIIIVEPIK